VQQRFHWAGRRTQKHTDERREDVKVKGQRIKVKGERHKGKAERGEVILKDMGKM
jgi:hypothetical protein